MYGRVHPGIYRDDHRWRPPDRTWACNLRFRRTPPDWGAEMPMQFRTSGCLMSIVLSVVLTIALNLLLRACAG